MTEEKEKLDHMINFRATDKLYKSLMGYLKKTGESISIAMRQATYDYLLFKKAMKENGYKKPKEERKQVQEVNVDLEQIEANKFCDGDSCEIDPRKMEKC